MTDQQQLVTCGTCGAQSDPKTCSTRYAGTTLVYRCRPCTRKMLADAEVQVISR